MSIISIGNLKPGMVISEDVFLTEDSVSQKRIHL